MSHTAQGGEVVDCAVVEGSESKSVSIPGAELVQAQSVGILHVCDHFLISRERRGGQT